MVGVHDEHDVDRFGQVRGRAARLERDDVLETIPERPLANVVEHRRLDIDCVNGPARDRLGQAHGEVARACTDVGHRRGGRQRQRLDDAGWHLPGVPRRIVERFRVPLRIVEAVLHVVGLAPGLMLLRIKSQPETSERDRDRCQ